VLCDLLDTKEISSHKINKKIVMNAGVNDPHTEKETLKEWTKE
jgi:hypothetical protein